MDVQGPGSHTFALELDASMSSGNERVEYELFTLGHRNLVVTGVGQIGLASLVALVARENAASTILLVWWLFMVLMGGVYWLEFWWFRGDAAQNEPNTARLRKWLLHRRVLQFVVGLGWGGLGFLLVPGAHAHNVIIMTAFVGMLGYAGAANTANDFVGFVVSGMAIITVMVSQLPAVFGADAMPIIVMCVMYLVALISVVRNTQRLMRESIRLRLSNAVLARSSAEQAERAEQANREKSEFLAAASHDLRQPVHALLLLVEAYRQQEPLAAKNPLLVHIAAAGQSINDLFNSLMELSRLESAAEPAQAATFDLSELIQRVWNRAQPQAQSKRLRLRHFEASSVRGAVVCTDKVLLERILGNLLSNAIRYTPDGGVLLSLRRAHAGDGLWIEVWDSGIGIDAADQARIFSPYVQVGNQERDRSKGLGLGLAIVSRAADVLGAEICLTSTPGRGSRFRLHLPGRLRATGSAPATQAPAQAEQAAYSVSELAGRRVLLVDDDPMVQLAMQALLLTWKVDLRCATRGDDSVLVVCAGEWEPECVLSDFRLPGKRDGIALLDWLLAQYPRAVGLLLTGEMIQSVHAQADDAGYLVLTKPINPAVLARTLSAVLNRRKNARQT